MLVRCQIKKVIIDSRRGFHRPKKASARHRAIKTAFLLKSKISEIQSSQRTQHQHKQNRYSLYRSLDCSIVLKYPAIAITIKAIYKSSF